MTPALTSLLTELENLIKLSNKALPAPWSSKVLLDYHLSPHDNDTPYIYGQNETKVMCGLWPIHGPKEEDTSEAERITFATIELVAALRNFIHSHGETVLVLLRAEPARTITLLDGEQGHGGASFDKPMPNADYTVRVEVEQPASAEVSVPTDRLEHIQFWIQTAAETGIENKWGDGSLTPNGKMLLQLSDEIKLLIAGSRS